MSLNDILREEITLIKQDGRRITNIRASVQNNLIITGDQNIPIEEGDTFERLLPNGTLETYIVTDLGFNKGIGSITSHYGLFS